jgi:hypothetical protein
LSVTLDRLPAVVDRATVAPPVVILAPLESLSWTVITVVETPSRTIEFDAAVMVEVVADGAAVTIVDALAQLAVTQPEPAVGGDVPPVGSTEA